MKQLGLALMSYTQDYDEMLPPVFNDGSGTRVRYHEMIGPYIKNNQIRFCPSHSGIDKNDINNSSYAGVMNGHIFVQDALGRYQRSIGAFTRPSELACIVEAGSWYCYFHPGNVSVGGTDAGDYTMDNLCSSRTATDWLYFGRHNDGGNCLFLDGHVKWQKSQAVAKNIDIWGCNGI